MPFFEDYQIGASDSNLDISSNREQKCNIYVSKSKFGCCQSETSQILKIDLLAVVLWLVKHFAFFLLARYFWSYFYSADQL